jgi:hypothetical protein
MADRIPDYLLKEGPFSKWELVIRDAFDLKELYVRIHDFLVDENFKDLGVGSDNYETYYYEKDNGDGTTDHKIWWRAARFSYNPAHKNIKFYMQLDMKTVRMETKEVIKDGQKVKLDSGELEFKFYLFIDYANNKNDQEAFENHFILKHFKKLFWNQWNKEPTENAKGEAMAFSNDLYSLIQVYTGVRPQGGGRKEFVQGQSWN